jgi:hypothetical protein
VRVKYADQVKAALEPVVKIMRDLDGFMLGMVGRIKISYNRFRAVDREIAMECKHGVCWIDRVRPVDPDFAVSCAWESVVVEMRVRNTAVTRQPCKRLLRKARSNVKAQLSASKVPSCHPLRTNFSGIAGTLSIS